MIIRPLERTELAAFFAYLNDHLADNGKDGAALFQPMPRSASRLPAEKEAGFITGLEAALDAPAWRRVWIAIDDTLAIMGHVDLRARPESAAAHRALLGTGVHRDARRRGLGRRLLEVALAWAREETALDWIDLEVLSQNAAARRLYERSGFAVTGEHADLFRIDGEQLGYVTMTRYLR